MEASEETIRLSMPCVLCGEKMVGIMDYEARKECERCENNGNTPRRTLKLPWRKDDEKE